ncbi:MAG: methionine--tRNA ligase [Halobacteriaceae archaeon]
MSHEEFPTDDPAVVTCGLPYANGPLHLGHLIGLISADVYARSLRRLGQDVAYVSGSDMHGTPIAVNAAQEGVTPEEFAMDWHEEFAETLPQFNIEFDNYGHTHDETNTELTKDIVRTLDEEGHIYEKDIKVAWDPEADQPLPDRFVEGTCPYCGAKARGDECDEGCQRHLEPGEIEDPHSTVTGNPAEYRDRTHKFFRLSEFEGYLRDFLDRLEGTPNAKNQPREWVEDELQDWCITRDLDWGIDYPGEGGEDLVLYVWVDAPIEYIASSKQYTERVGADVWDWEDVWRDDDGEIVHVIGPDIIQHHTVFWPAMLHGAGYTEPRAVMASGFLTLNGESFSTSRNRAVWADDYLDSEFHPDLLRYYLTTQGGFHQDTDFAWERFQQRVNSELSDTVGNFVYRSLLFAHRNFDGTPDADVSDEARAEIEDAVAAFEDAINDYSPRLAGEAATSLAAFGNRYIQRNEPWKLTDEDPERAAEVIRDSVQVTKAVAILLAPFTPAKADEMWAMLNEEGSVHDATLDDCLAAPPAEFGEPEEPFEKIEDEAIAARNAELEARVEEAEEAAEDEAPDLEPIADERISFDDFQDLDVRVGEIEVAEPIDGADDLVRLDVDIGVETRQIVAGIKGLHDLDELPGTRVVILANLEPAELFGVESNGMLLAAGEDADLLTTLGDSVPGTKVR